jgi:metal-responsive CopG/Arc/MetJ family transcriptional regulator
MVIPSYTTSMKTAISVPDETFAQVDTRAAELGISRSEFYATAARRWLTELESANLTSDIDDALDRISDSDQAERALLTTSGARRLAAVTEADEW